MFIYPDNNRYREHPYIEYDNYALASEANWKGEGYLTNKIFLPWLWYILISAPNKVRVGGEATPPSP